jgi:starvation-inducible outer membrane lipoprotein
MTHKVVWISGLFAAALMVGSGCSTTPKQTAGTITQKSIRAKVQGAKTTGRVAAQGARVVGGAAAGAVGTAVGRE